MSDTQNNGGGNGQQQQQPPVIINGQYVKDLSFESPSAPGVFQQLQKAQPDMKLNVNVAHAKVENPENANTHEVVLEFTAEMKVGDTVGFICELKYAGMFTLNVPEEHLQAFLLIECPRILFPYARQLISDATQQGGFMPLFLQPIDFAAMYQQNANNQAADLDAEVAQTIKEKGEG